MTSENWMNNVSFLDLLKIRASFDMAGNDKIPFYANRTYFASEALNNNGFGQVIANIGNDRLKWETTRTWRFGFDASLFANRWTMAFDFYTSKTSDLLIQKRAKDEVGLEYYWSNGGDAPSTCATGNSTSAPLSATTRTKSPRSPKARF